MAAKRAGAEVFLVPSTQSPDDLAAAREVSGSEMTIITVANLEEALAALEKLGGSGLTNAAIDL